MYKRGDSCCQSQDLSRWSINLFLTIPTIFRDGQLFKLRQWNRTSAGRRTTLHNLWKSWGYSGATCQKLFLVKTQNSTQSGTKSIWTTVHDLRSLSPSLEPLPVFRLKSKYNWEKNSRPLLWTRRWKHMLWGCFLPDWTGQLICINLRIMRY